mmetsp:Transcript_12479/g.31989  ORF Transcript_12479/g.31989 Transcript_12479/m.31989 type:complete len:479 (-) Transcript_12479:245-1681(-)
MKSAELGMDGGRARQAGRSPQQGVFSAPPVVVLALELHPRAQQLVVGALRPHAGGAREAPARRQDAVEALLVGVLLQCLLQHLRLRGHPAAAAHAARAAALLAAAAAHTVADVHVRGVQHQRLQLLGRVAVEQPAAVQPRQPDEPGADLPEHGCQIGEVPGRQVGALVDLDDVRLEGVIKDNVHTVQREEGARAVRVALRGPHHPRLKVRKCLRHHLRHVVHHGLRVLADADQVGTQHVEGAHPPGVERPQRGHLPGRQVVVAHHVRVHVRVHFARLKVHRGRPDEHIIEEVDAQRVDRRDDHVEPSIKELVVDEEGVGHSLLDQHPGARVPQRRVPPGDALHAAVLRALEQPLARGLGREVACKRLLLLRQLERLRHEVQDRGRFRQLHLARERSRAWPLVDPLAGAECRQAGGDVRLPVPPRKGAVIGPHDVPLAAAVLADGVARVLKRLLHVHQVPVPDCRNIHNGRRLRHPSCG